MATIDYSIDKTVTRPISLKGVSDLIGVGNYDVARVCISDKINKWAKYKPVKDSSVCPEYTDAFYRQSDPILYSTPHIYAMIVTQNINSGAKNAWDMYNDDEDKEYNWKYDQPTKNGGLPFRLGDFGGVGGTNGYYHLAKQFCTSKNFKYEGGFQIDEIKVSEEATETDTLRFYVDGIKDKGQGGIGFSDLASMDEGVLVLCANMYDEDGNYIGEYVNHKVKLYEAAQESDYQSISDDGMAYDDENDRWKFVDMVLDKATYFNTGDVNYAYVVLTLDFVKYDGSQWVSVRKMVIPYSDENYWIKKIKITKISRIVEAYKVWNKSGSRTESDFISINDTITAGFDYFKGPLIWFKVSETSEAIEFVPLSTQSSHNAGYFLRTKYFNTEKGEYVINSASLDTMSGSGKSYPFYIEVPSDPSGEYSTMVDVFFKFDDIWGLDESEIDSSHIYVADLYMVYKNESGEEQSEIRIGNIQLKYQN